ncbi:type VI secretion system Vgr family protein [Herbaspirillum sp. GCM10030257]|uniref:type VI secretion system Vgr family protein n=1 Tax=Herbaspirillum sp. GCM10030257 TaxID=3273393 RepID=UPI0036149BE6
MSFKPFDSENEAGSLEPDSLVAPVADKLLQPVASLTKSVQALQSGQIQNALTEGLSAVGPFNKNLAKALGTAKLLHTAASAAEEFGKKSASQAPSHVIADHPLTGSAINDFAVKTPPFVPEAAKAGNSNDDEAGDDSAAMLQALSQEFSDETRLLRFYSALPANIALYIEDLQGHAGLSELFSFELTLLSKDAGLELKSLMGKNASVGIQQADGSEHYVNGYINSFAFTSADGGFAFYKAEIVPWLAFLKRRINSRIFQNKSVIDVLKTVFSEDYPGLADFEFRVQEEYKPESYIVQYHESDQNFVCRLLEKNGLFYFFEHGPSGHKMVIGDKSSDNTCCMPHKRHAKIKFNAGNRTHDEDAVMHIAAQRTLQSSKVALNTFNYKAPLSPQYVELPTDAIQGDVPMLEVYDGTPAFGYKDVGDGMRQAKQRLEVLEWQAKVFKGASDCRSLEPGRTFILTEQELFDPLDETASDFLVLSVSYTACNNYFHRGGAAVYSNSFTCIRRKIPFRPRQQHAKPTMPGPQTATVVGPKGTEIHTDKYGRIKVQFHWDRYGRNDDASSCWIRVSQPWAGQGWGTVAIPRIGQEVIIDYLEGDPDRPVCTGRLYNENQPLPYALPGAAHVMGFKSRSTPGGGGYCEIVIHDKKGQELVNIHSQKDMVTTVQNNQATVINGSSQTNTVTNGFHVTKVKKKVELESQTEFIHLKAATGITLEVGASKIHMAANGKITIEGVHVDVIGSARIDLNTNSATPSQPASNNKQGSSANAVSSDSKKKVPS